MCNIISVQIQLFCDGLRGLLREYWGANNIIKSKEHNRQFRDKVVEKFKAGLGYKKISQALNISQSTVPFIFGKWKEYGTMATVPKHGCPPKLEVGTRRALIRDAAKRLMVTLEELQRSTAPVGESVHRTTTGRARPTSGLNGGRVARRKPWIKKKKSIIIGSLRSSREETTNVKEAALVG